MLLDSGADYPMLPKPMAEHLGIDVAACPEDTTVGLGSARVGLYGLDVVIGQHQREYQFRATFQTPKDHDDYPPIPLMGREPLFRIFDVQFRMGFTEALGKFTLKLVKKKRDFSKYWVGGKEIQP